MNLARGLVNALLPPGPVWVPKALGWFDRLLNGLAVNVQYLHDLIAPIAELRNPETTPMLDELEYDHGLLKNDTLTEATRRMQLAAWLKIQNTGGPFQMQAALRLAGFDVYVYSNSPATDPSLYLTEQYLAYCGGVDSYCGGEDAYCSISGGLMLVNGDVYQNTRNYTALCGDVFCGEEDAFCGAYIDAEPELYQYPVPTDPATWPFVFFVGGFAGSLTTIPMVSIPANRRAHFESIILRYKPLETWAVLVVSYN